MGFLGITLVLFLSLLTNPAQGTSLGYYEPQADMETTDNGYGILDTFSLSFVGNLNFANAIEGVKKIVEGISNCKIQHAS